MSMAFKSPNYQNLQRKGKEKEETEPKKKLKKIKSIKGKRILLKSDLGAESSGSCLDLVKSSSQEGSESEDTSVISSTNGSSPRISVIKGGAERKKTLKKSKSNQLSRMGSFKPKKYVKSRFDPKQPLVNKENESPTSSDVLANKPTRTFSRIASLRSVRVLKSKPSFKSKRPSMRKLSEMPQDLNVERPTCSSTLKGSRFSKKIELHHDESGDINSVIKVCPYHHCSLHGHSPPQKQFLSNKRRSMKTQRRNKPEKSSKISVKQSSDQKEEKDGGENLFSGKSDEDKSHLTSSEGRYDETQVEKYVFETVGIDPDLISRLSEDEKSCILKGSTPNDFGEEKEYDADFSSLSSKSHSFEELNGFQGEKIEKFVSDDESVCGFSQERDTEVLKPQLEKSNNFSMWHLIHRQMISGLATEDDEIVEKQVDVSDSDIDSQEVELRKAFAIKLVREAIEKILLPEVQDQSSDDQSVTSDVLPEKELGKNEVEGEKKTISTSVENNNISSPEEEKKVSDKKAPKSWSYLKKVILLQRFVKELEKVKKFEPKKPRHLPEEPNPETETVSLRHQMMNEKKNSEEWMLDYAIRQVVSELAPTQKRKVSLLVKAFETVVPPPANRQSSIRFSKKKSSQGVENELDKSVSVANDKDLKGDTIVPSHAPKPMHEKDQGVHRISSLTSKLDVMKNKFEESFSVANDKDFKGNKITQTNRFRAPVHEKDQEVRQEKISSLNSNIGDNENVLDRSFTVADDKFSKASLEDDDSQPSAKFTELDNSHDVHMKPSHITKEEKIGDSKPVKLVLRDFPPLKSPHGGDKTQLDKQNHIKMWHMICQHVVSEIAEGTEMLLDGSEEEKEQVDDTNKFPTHQKIKFSKSDAVKLVQEAVNEILLPKVENGAQEDKGYADNTINTPKDEKEELVEQPKNWMKLKKLLLLKRSIKALEKVRNFNPKPVQLLPLKKDLDGEKVDLRHQMTDEKKKAEQWMLDYAVQHIVTKLTPARKRRVAMLVEAFEAVVPFPDI